MKINHTILLSILSTSLFLACSPAPENNRFNISNIDDEITITDKTTKLQWVNGSEFKEFDGCKGFPKKPTNTKAFIKKEVFAHCEALKFAGHDDWRVPTAKENQAFVTALKKANITPYYTIKACPRVIGTDGDKIMTTNTHNTKPIGEINPWKDGTNGGVRCVREKL